MALTEIERALTRSKSLVFRTLKELEQLQLVSRDDRRHYRLGIAAFEVGAAYLEQGHLGDSFREVLRELAERAGESTNLGALQGDEVLYLMKFQGRSSYVTISRVGGRVPASCTAIGKALLATLDPADMRSRVREPLTQLTPYSPATLADLERELAETRARGYALDQHETVVGRSGLAVTIPHPDQPIGHAAISLSIDASRFEVEKERLLDLLLGARGRIERELHSRALMEGTS